MRFPFSDNNLLRRILSILCVLVILFCAFYTLSWYRDRARIHDESERYSSLYSASTAAPTDPPAVTLKPSESPTPAPTAAPTAIPVQETLPVPLDLPIATPDSDTIVYSLPTTPPVQESFSALLEENPDTIGFLRIGKIVNLPVVQRVNDNEFYLSHSFDGNKNHEGTLFLDGMNLLVPEDDCLIVYGHNMNNGTMFGNLRSFLNKDFFRSHAEISFDTLYENRTYVPFAAFNASMDANGRNSFDLRKFLMSPAEFDEFIISLKDHSVFSVPLDVSYGDRLLLLVTCDYTNDDGRFILALRQLRDGESLAAVSEAVAKAMPR